MKKFILSVMIGLLSLSVFSQYPDLSAPLLFNNRETYGDIRNKINLNNINVFSKVNENIDSIYRHHVRMFNMNIILNTILDTTISHNDRLKILEGVGQGAIYTASNGLVLANNDIRLGGSLLQNTILYTGGYNFLLGAGAGNPAMCNPNIYFTSSDLYLRNSNHYSVPTSSVILNLKSDGFFTIESSPVIGISTQSISTTSSGIVLSSSVMGTSNIVTLGYTGGLKYSGDYSSLYTSRSIPDWAAVNKLNDTIIIQIICTTDTLTVTPTSTGDVLAVSDDLNGCDLIKIEARSSQPGNGTVSVNAYRVRTEVPHIMTSTAASLLSDGTIDTTYDDLLDGDFIRLSFSEAGATDETVGVFAILTFVR